ATIFANGMIFNLGLQVSDLMHPWTLALWVWGTVIMNGYLLALLLHFSLIFPRRHQLLVRYPILPVLVYSGMWVVYAGFLALRWSSAPSLTARLLLLTQGTTIVMVVYFLFVLATWLSSYRTSHNALERRQLRWVTWGTTVALVPYMALALIPSLFGRGVPLGANFSVVGLFLCTVPTTFTVAILRANLFDIDRIINRTLVYTALTASLVLVYLSSVILLETVFRTLTDQSSQITIVTSTLGIAALFNPLRHRIQEFIDQRFYRRKYDAQQVLAAFGQTVRDEVDLERLTGELLAVIEETMQPAHVSLWLREPPSGSSFPRSTSGL
ncbi:MAG: hypothetical protein M3220_07290, partial [Chloroflexota bacterium]|nr:hypothetical protein [Chloroflexota bacterium]